MKRPFTIWSVVGSIVLASAMLLVTAPSPALAAPGDTLTVNASPAGNLNNVIQGDTLSNGARAHPNRVYRLYRDSIYYFNAPINVTFPLTIIADSESHRPPVIAPAINPDNSSPSKFLNIYSGTHNLTLRYLYLTGVRPDQVTLGSKFNDCIDFSSDSTVSIVRNCVFESYGGALDLNSGNYNKFFVYDNVFRNMMHPTSWFKGEAFLSVGGFTTDSVVMINNTMFCNNAYAKASVDYTLYTRFEHNTIFLNCVNPLNDFVMTSAEYKNNIFYGTCANAQENAEIQQYYFENSISPSSTFSFDSLNTGPSHIPVTESNRVITVQNNSVYWPAKLKAFWLTPLMDTLIPPVFLNVRTAGMFANKSFYPYFKIGGNDTTNDPGFPAGVLGQVDSLIKFASLIRLGTQTNPGFLWNYNPNGNLFAPVWPLPENLAYSNTTMQHQGTDGYALGDLNWFPSQRAAWLLTGVATRATAPESFSLAQNYPNPFNPSTTIQYALSKAQNVQLKVYNLLGQEVATLVDGRMAAGFHSVQFNAARLASGVYIYKIVAGDFVSAKKMILLK
ncbi:MAG TPA: T9SS type A sorting domain-containing protein [Bacteroidota bacterium]|nr:T9SS type A sorting domain-containing protein [Bacteroidota bacterium]